MKRRLREEDKRVRFPNRALSCSEFAKSAKGMEDKTGEDGGGGEVRRKKF